MSLKNFCDYRSKQLKNPKISEFQMFCLFQEKNVLIINDTIKETEFN